MSGELYICLLIPRYHYQLKTVKHSFTCYFLFIFYLRQNTHILQQIATKTNKKSNKKHFIEQKRHNKAMK